MINPSTIAAPRLINSLHRTAPCAQRLATDGPSSVVHNPSDVFGYSAGAARGGLAVNNVAGAQPALPTGHKTQVFRVATVVVPSVIPDMAGYNRAHNCELIREHKDYVEALTQLGFNVVEFKNDSAWPASIFPEDPAVIIDANHVVITVPGAEHRVGEGEAMAKFFGQYTNMNLYDMRTVRGARLDGGDVLRVGRHMYIGLSIQTNQLGATYLAEVAKHHGLKPHIVPVGQGLHLKSSCTLAGTDRLFYDPHLINPAFLDLLQKNHAKPSHRLQFEPVEHLGSNVLYLGKSPRFGRECVLVSKSAHTTAKKLRNSGLLVVEVQKAAHERLDGRMTCSSLRIPAAGAWCT